MRILAIEGAEHGILVNTISPVGYTSTRDGHPPTKRDGVVRSGRGLKACAGEASCTLLEGRTGPPGGAQT
jgi:NAD(P)-dependent dehydrogenase (short-subunit alcohol dehydrogenase family)